MIEMRTLALAKPCPLLPLFAGFLLALATGLLVPSTLAHAQELRAYCAKVVDDDRVQPVPEGLISEARRFFDISVQTSDSYVQATTSVRCMSGRVWLCSYGANLICEKADVSRDSPGAVRFCNGSPDSIGVPMSATGHATIYEWKCVGREARIVRQSSLVDARGFLAGNWTPLE